MDFLKALGIENILNSDEKTKGITSINPSTGKPIATISGCTEEEYDATIITAAKTFQAWRQWPAPKRGNIVRALGEKLREHKKNLGKLIAFEMGKSLQEGEGEVQEMIDMADFAVGQSRMLYGMTTHSERSQHRLYEQWHPLGVVGVITAFNFPVAVWAWNAFLAIICGNTVVWKPSSKTPLCALAIQHLCDAVMREHHVAGLFSIIIPSHRRIAEKILEDKRVALISFTGSCETGRHVNQVVAKRLGRVLLELGGNNAIIVDETADLNIAIPAIVFGAIGTAGQRCTTTRRLFIQEKRFDEVVKQLVHAYGQVKIGSPLDENNLMGPLIDKAAVERYAQVIAQLKKEGAEILFGGRVLEREGYFVEPTLIKAKQEWPIVKQETFAPILYVMPYRELSDAIYMQNDVEQGLSSALFTNNLRHSEYFLSAIGSDCGIANINVGTSGAEIGGAFGGEKATGGGREAGSDAWKAYMRRQTNTINWGNTLPLAQGITFLVQ